VSRAARLPNPAKNSTRSTIPTIAAGTPTHGMKNNVTTPTMSNAIPSPIMVRAFPAGERGKLRGEVEDDEPLLGHLPDRPGGAFLRVPGVLDAAVRHLVGAERRRLVDRDGAELQSCRGLDGVVERGREDAGLQPVAGRVRALKTVREAHEGVPPKLAAEKPVEEADGIGERPAGPVAPERFAVLQALLAYLLAACGPEREATIPAHEIVERFNIPEDGLEEHLSLLNLVNFGGGCYTVYAELQGDVVHVDKELYGETFRAAPRLTPLEARAIRLALEYVGPMIAADAHTPLDRVRRKLEETFGQFELAQTPEPQVDTQEEQLVRTFSEAIANRRLVEIEYQKEGEQTWSKRVVEPYSLERELPNWRVHTWDRTRDGERDQLRTVGVVAARERLV
jgi:hypothetical protein